MPDARRACGSTAVLTIVLVGPQCGTVKLVMYSEKEPAKADTRVVDPGNIQQIWQDFAQYRE